MNILHRKRVIGDIAGHSFPTPALECALAGETRTRLHDARLRNAGLHHAASPTAPATGLMRYYEGLVSLGHGSVSQSAVADTGGVLVRTRAWREKAQPHATAPRRTLIVGADDKAQTLARELQINFPTDYNVVGFVDDDRAAASDSFGPILGNRAQLADLVEHHDIDEVIVANCLTERQRLIQFVGRPRSEAAEAAPQELDDAVLFDEAALPVYLSHVLPSPLQQGLKRGFDIAFSLLALIVLAPILALVAVAIKLTSPGPVFYRQQRVGRNGRLFTIYKCRSMKVDAESKTGPVLAQRNDDRTTPLGRILRATHIDEAPQFYNVLRGDMSIVGPRPERPCFVEAYNRHIPAYPQRHLVRPGITGLAQVNAGYLSHAYVKLHYDLEYVYNHNVWRDICILFKTPVSVVRSMKCID